MNITYTGRIAALLIALMLAACNGESSSTASFNPVSAATCDPADPLTLDECGTVLIGFTDAEGDFLNYTVDVLQLTLIAADGRKVKVIPQQTRINFSDYVDLTELMTAASVPPARYVAGSIRLDYADAEVFVDAGGTAKATEVTDLAGNALGQTNLEIELSSRDPLTVVKSQATLLQFDFDLDASHIVDITPTPAQAIANHVILAEVVPVDEKELRVRGPLLTVDEATMSYSIVIRPFQHRDGDFGRFTINVSAATEFAINEELYTGIEGLRILSAASEATATIATGTLTVANGNFKADRVLAGTSVPGHDRDAVIGNVIKREGNLLTVRGATIIPRDSATDRRAHFHDNVVVEVSTSTKIFKDWHHETDLTIDALSIGQRVTIRGEQRTSTMDALAPQIFFDATEGAVRMHITQLAGRVNTVLPGQTDITLHSIDRRRVSIFDFTGTGFAPETDADPDNYEVRTVNLDLADFSTGKPIIVRGFPAVFATAPADFTGNSVIDYTDVRSSLGLGWGRTGTDAPFVSLEPDGLVLDNLNADIEQRHYIKQGDVLIDLTALDANTTIVPRESDRALFSIKAGDSLRLYSDWSQFADDLATGLGGGSTAQSMFAHGKYDNDSNVFVAHKLGVMLLGP